MGLHYTLNEHPNVEGKQTLIRLVGTQKEIIVDQPLEKISAMWYKWQILGEMIQIAFKDLLPEQREFLITGITPHEWNEIFSEEEEEE